MMHYTTSSQPLIHSCVMLGDHVPAPSPVGAMLVRSLDEIGERSQQHVPRPIPGCHGGCGLPDRVGSCDGVCRRAEAAAVSASQPPAVGEGLRGEQLLESLLSSEHKMLNSLQSSAVNRLTACQLPCNPALLSLDSAASNVKVDAEVDEVAGICYCGTSLAV